MFEKGDEDNSNNQFNSSLNNSMVRDVNENLDEAEAFE